MDPDPIQSQPSSAADATAGATSASAADLTPELNTDLNTELNTERTSELSTPELLEQLRADRQWLLRQLDAGHWSQWRLDLAALERELGQLLDQAQERL